MRRLQLVTLFTSLATVVAGLSGCADPGPGIAGPAPNTDAGVAPSDAGSTPLTANEFGCYTDGPRWTYGNRQSPFMHPGGDCIDCHRSSREGPAFACAGTVMNSWDERTDCSGAGGVTVELTGADGTVVSTQTNRAGNFWFRVPVLTPYTARVISPDGVVNAMATPQIDLDCMHCHTETGANGAPGRIVAL